MCRWLAYSGSPVCLEDLLFKPKNSLVVQSKHSQLGATTTNGYGFGVGWYGAAETLGLFHSTDVSTLRDQYPDNPVLHVLSDDARLVVSEPLGDLRGAWQEVPESSCLVVHGNQMEMRAFAPGDTGQAKPRSGPQGEEGETR